MSAPADIRARLRAWLAERLGEPRLELRDVTRHSEGFSWQTYTLSAGGHGFAVRVQPPDGILAPYDIEGQYRLHDALREHSAVPVPKLLWLELDPEVLGQPFYVMERVEGHVPVQWRPDDPRSFPTEAARRALGHDFVDVQAAIHAVDWQASGLDYLAEDPLARWQAMYEDSVLVELPLIREALAWLRRRLVPGERRVLVHGDYRIGNVMEREQRVVAVFDWELAHIGDPIEDIAYAGLPLWRGRDRRLSHLLEPDEYFARYEQRTGVAVDPEAFRAWTVLGLVKAAACHLRAARAFEDGRTNDLRLAALGHQVQHVLRHLQRELEAA